MIDELEPEHDRIRALTARQVKFADSHCALLSERVVNRRVCDAHGDLRPEHIFLTEQPQIIDCLEFSAALRQLDTAEELAFLALECERLGRTDIGARLIGLYREACSDAVPAGLLCYYRSRRALVRAFLCAWHLEDGLSQTEATQWLRQARWYIGQAESAVDEAWQTSTG
jgi:aminoglycoside phosphotransferase family enzyme